MTLTIFSFEIALTTYSTQQTQNPQCMPILHFILFSLYSKIYPHWIRDCDSFKPFTKLPTYNLLIGNHQFELSQKLYHSTL